jgi:DnaK suppressor protein
VSGIDPAEDVGPAFDHRRDLRELTAHEAELEEVAAALRRLDDGSYGSCEVCGAGIAEAVAANPLARRCLEHEEPRQAAEAG